VNAWGTHREVERVKPPRQLSVAQLPEHQQDAAMDATERASERYPSIEVEGHLLHICEMDGDWQVWLNTEDANFTGLCVSSCPTREAAITEAVKVFEAVVDALQGPPRGDR
jgi:hypothetical protein